MVRSYAPFSSQDFYPRPPRGGRPLEDLQVNALIEFLSTPSARRATSASMSGRTARRFLSTPSARRATQSPSVTSSAAINFYPRPPRGGRPVPRVPPMPPVTISIHALREEGDHESRAVEYQAADFYPRPPRGGRPDCNVDVVRIAGFLSTPSARRATL